MAMSRVSFGEWLPDQPELSNPGATVAENVLPSAIGYRQIGALTAVTSALTDYPRGHFHETDESLVDFNYAGDETNLYVDNALTWNDVSGSTYATASGERWEFAKFGSKVYATNFSNVLQAVTIGNVANTFAAAAGSPPNARHIAVVRDFLVLGNTSTGGTATPERVHWSGINDPTTWTVDATTQADVNDFPDSGAVQAIAGGEYGVVFQERAVTRMTYAGSPVIFQMDQVLPDIGMLDPGGSMVQHGNFIYYIGSDGFRVICNGQQTERIGVNKVDRTMLAELDYAYLHRISSAIDPINGLVFWALPVTGNTGGRPNKIYVYDWFNKKWSYLDIEVDLITSAPTSSTSGVKKLAAFDSAKKLGYFTGTALSATIETPEFQVDMNNRALIRSIYPLVDGASATITSQVGSRETQNAAFSYDATVYTPETSGWHRVRNSGRFHRVRVLTAGAFDFAMGVDVVGVQSGRR